ncbi:hypothetical protein SAMN04489835_0267 [Mycolicibacterium rutilum]|uniref:Uncharacterized protein n=1 Tax=Mycolicibacterium rutilum TaxID=370526 RepID=A0A1H6IIQ5_MYCRU|nr:hypothetical protein [Mycolicibacterium rutilum]SEH47781.1 hypothetical protein SAMN04489835_0267 [Mycolicibacterium rutilum]
MAEGTGGRLDIVDIAHASGWEVESTIQADVFTKGASRIQVQYSQEDMIENAVKNDGDGDRGALGNHAESKVAQVRYWLTGRPIEAPAAPTRFPEADFTTEPSGWTRPRFIAALEDPGDRAFLAGFLQLMDANGQQPAQGTHARLTFGKRPGGAVFVYPFGRRFPPFKFSIKDGRLMISGCWKGNFKVSGHPGFAEIATLLGQDESGPAKAVPVAGLDPDEVWQIGDRVSRAINR